MTANSERRPPQNIGVGVIGTGSWGRNMLRALSSNENTRLLHVCDQNPSALDAISHLYPGVRMTRRCGDVLADSDVEAVYIATPPATHAELASAALRAGKHVLVEKPLSMTLADANAVRELAERHGRTLMVGHTFLYSPPVLKLKELIEGGALGTISYVESQRVSSGRYQAAGVLWDLAPHDVSIILFCLGHVPCGVSATGRPSVRNGREDEVFITLDFPNGAVADIHVSWLSPVKLRKMIVSGSRCTAVYDDALGPNALKIFGHAGGRDDDPVIPLLEDTEPLRAEWAHFVDCIRTGDMPRSDAANGSRVVQIMEAAERALKTGRREPVETNIRRFWSADPAAPSWLAGDGADLEGGERDTELPGVLGEARATRR
jgi:predicted dehydrogenase